jgi:hypothetical protein
LLEDIVVWVKYSCIQLLEFFIEDLQNILSQELASAVEQDCVRIFRAVRGEGGME